MRRFFGYKRANCNIIESNAIEAVLEHAKSNNTLVIFDIDNTLIHTNQELGSDAWAFWFVKQKLKEGLRPSQALECMFDLFRHIHSHIDVYPVEEKTVGTVKRLRDLEIPTFCLTGRQASMIDVTQEQLNNNGFIFNCPQDLSKTMTLKMKYPVEMANGIICGGMNNKGDVLIQLFQYLNYKMPECIVFVDDRVACVESMSKNCSKNGINFTGLRYGYMDSFSAGFDGEKAKKQLEELLKLYEFSH